MNCANFIIIFLQNSEYVKSPINPTKQLLPDLKAVYEMSFSGELLFASVNC